MLPMLTSEKYDRWKLAQKQQVVNQLNKKDRLKNDWNLVIKRRWQHANAILERIVRFKPIYPTTKILELGSGSHGACFFHTKGVRFGLDPLASFYRSEYSDIQKGSSAKICAGMGEKLPFQYASFDIVLSDNVIDHTADAKEILREVNRVLTDDGIFYLALHLHHVIYRLFNLTFIALFNLKLTPNTPYYKAHTYFFTPKIIRNTITEAKFNIIYADIPNRLAKNRLSMGSIRSCKNVYCTLICTKS